MKTLLIFLVFYLLNSNTLAQISSRAKEIDEKARQLSIELDHLDPIPSIFDYGNEGLEYHNKIRTVLLKYQKEQLLSRLVVTPSFKPEYVIRIEKNSENHYVSKLYFDKSIWATEDFSKIKISETTKIISQEIAEKVHHLFEIALNQTKSTIKTRKFTDGVNYYFTSVGNGRYRSGKKHSPRKETKIFELIEVIESLLHKNLDKQQLLINIERLQKKFNSKK